MTKDTVDHASLANAIRALAMDAVQKANSGHPGMPMGMADVATVLYSKFLKFDPSWPEWPDRDRVILSAGHGSMLLYALLYLTGYPKPTLEDIKTFRQLGSPCAGHPEFGVMPGVETTTGPLSQGIGNAVGMAMAERSMRETYGKGIVDHYTYVICGDGCLMEGLSHETISLAGFQKLERLILLFDNNKVSIDGPTSLAVSIDHKKRFEAAGWFVQEIDGHDVKAIEAALAKAKASKQPSLISCKTIIGFGAPTKQGTAETHGQALGEDEVAAARKKLKWPHPPFEIPKNIHDAWKAFGARWQNEVEGWKQRYSAMEKEPKRIYEARIRGDLPPDLQARLIAHKKKVCAERKTTPTRKASGDVLELVNGLMQSTVGGSADLTDSNNTLTSTLETMTAAKGNGRYIHYGVREFGMATAMNGMALHGGFIPYGGTFLVFSDYMRPAIRLAAMMGIRVIFVMTHDSIGLGEDGPTHQPIEHLLSLRAIPNLNVFRPADAVETTECWTLALADKRRPSVLALTRQKVTAAREKHFEDNMCARGGYILKQAGEKPKVTLIGTGSEVEVALAAQTLLKEKGVPTRVVSMPSLRHFEAQPLAYRREVLGGDALKVSIEAGITRGWESIVGPDGLSLGIERFGFSAPYPALYEHFGLTGPKVADKVLTRLKASA
jgi:transketolase